MKYQIADVGGEVRVALDGQLNFAANEEFEGLLTALLNYRNRCVVFDMSQLTAVDSVGLGLLYIARDDLETVGSRLCLAAPRGNTLRLLELTEAEKIFEIRL